MFSLRAIAVPVYGPSPLFGIGQGAMLPVVALSARDLGASFGTAAFVVALLGRRARGGGATALVAALAAPDSRRDA